MHVHKIRIQHLKLKRYPRPNINACELNGGYKHLFQTVTSLLSPIPPIRESVISNECAFSMDDIYFMR